jgi:hypothetical protein
MSCSICLAEVQALPSNNGFFVIESFFGPNNSNTARTRQYNLLGGRILQSTCLEPLTLEIPKCFDGLVGQAILTETGLHQLHAVFIPAQDGLHKRDIK